MLAYIIRDFSNVALDNRDPLRQNPLRTASLGDTIELYKRSHSWFLFPLDGVGLDEFRLMLGIPFCSPHVCLSLRFLAQLSGSILARHPSISPAETEDEGRMGWRDRADRREESLEKAAWEEKQVRREDYSQEVRKPRRKRERELKNERMCGSRKAENEPNLKTAANEGNKWMR